MVAPSHGIMVVLLSIMPCVHASEKMYGYDSEEKKLPMISARNTRGPGMSSFMTSLHTCASVEKPGMTVPWYCLVCLRAPRMASPFAACRVSTMMRLMFMLLAEMAEAAIHEMGACIPGPISMILQAVLMVVAM